MTEIFGNNCQTAKIEWICYCSTRILVFLPATAQSLFSEMFYILKSEPLQAADLILNLGNFMFRGWRYTDGRCIGR